MTSSIYVLLIDLYLNHSFFCFSLIVSRWLLLLMVQLSEFFYCGIYSLEKSDRVVVCNVHVLFNPKRGDIKLGQVWLLSRMALIVLQNPFETNCIFCNNLHLLRLKLLCFFCLDQLSFLWLQSFCRYIQTRTLNYNLNLLTAIYAICRPKTLLNSWGSCSPLPLILTCNPTPFFEMRNS